MREALTAGIPESETDKRQAGGWFEESLIILLHELDEEAEKLRFEIGEVDSSTADHDFETARARINELFRALQIDPQAWTGALVNPDGARAYRDEYLPIRRKEQIAISLKGVDVGDWFTEAAFGSLPIEQGGEGDMYILIVFDIGSNYRLKLIASGWCRDIYPEDDADGQERMIDEDGDDPSAEEVSRSSDSQSGVSFNIKFEAEFLKKGAQSSDAL